MVGELTAIKTDKLGGETVQELWNMLFAPLQTFVMLYNVILMLYNAIVMFNNDITQQIPNTKNKALYF